MILKSRRKIELLSVAGAMILALVLGLPSCDRKPEAITFGAIPSGSAALIYIAQEQGFLAANGISVTVKDYATGFATTDALLQGDVDIAWTAEFPIVYRVFAKEKISIIAGLSRFSDQYLFVRRDCGVEKLSDLRAKKIGIPRNTIVEFYLARFLELNGLNIQDVSIVDVPPPQSADAIASGRVDGVVTWEPYTSQIKAQQAAKVADWPVQNNQPGYGVIAARNDWIRKHPGLIQRFLKSLSQAEEYLIHHPGEAKDILKKRVNYDDVFMEIFWSENHFSVFLDQSLILAMEDEARWLIRNKLTDEENTPDFLDYIYVDALAAVKPGAVNIIR